jgi:aminoglycoside phosphotransferase (APT) family kinase protein
MTAELWDECTAFLVGLHLSSGWREPRAADAPEWDLGREFRAIEQHARPEARATLTLLEEALWERLAGVPRGWGHGDFWTANLLVAGNRLGTVVDWDSAAANAPPALDLMHLLLLSSRRARRLPHGSRCTQVLLPLARRGGDERLRGYCAATGSRSDSGTLEALALAYWASRVGRDLRVYRDRPGRPRWMNDNLHRPLSELQPAAL